MDWPNFSPTGLSQQHDFLLCGQNSVLMPHETGSCTSCQINMEVGVIQRRRKRLHGQSSFLGPSIPNPGWAQQGPDHKQLPLAKNSKSTKYFHILFSLDLHNKPMRYAVIAPFYSRGD